MSVFPAALRSWEGFRFLPHALHLKFFLIYLNSFPVLFLLLLGKTGGRCITCTDELLELACGMKMRLYERGDKKSNADKQVGRCLGVKLVLNRQLNTYKSANQLILNNIIMPNE